MAATDPEHVSLISNIVGWLIGLGSLGIAGLGLILYSVWGRIKQVEERVKAMDKALTEKIEKGLDDLDERKTNTEFCQTYHKALEDKINDGTKQFGNIDTSLKQIEKSQLRMLRRQDRMTVCLGLIAQKYGVTMPAEDKED